MSLTQPHVLILGLGYTGTGLANRIASRHPDWTVTGTVRGGRGGAAQVRYPLHPRVETIEYGEVLRGSSIDLRKHSHVLCTIPPDGGRGDAALRKLRCRFGGEVWTGYVSTTSVYGDHNGAFVDEESVLMAGFHGPPGSSGSKADAKRKLRIEEERAWLAGGADVFRCGGIYGPYRNVLDSLIRETRGSEGRSGRGTRRGKERTARCHVLDVCRVVERRMVDWVVRGETRTPSVSRCTVFNVVDDDDVGRREVEDYVLRETTLFLDYCRGIGLGECDALREAALAMTSSPSSSSGTMKIAAEKRVSNKKIKDELGVQLCFPTVWDGLEALVHRGDLRPFDTSIDDVA